MKSSIPCSFPLNRHVIWSIADSSIACMYRTDSPWWGTRHFGVFTLLSFAFSPCLPFIARKRSPKQMRNVDKRLIGYRNFVNTKRGLGCHADTSYSNIQLRFSIYYERCSSGCEVKGIEKTKKASKTFFSLLFQESSVRQDNKSRYRGRLWNSFNALEFPMNIHSMGWEASPLKGLPKLNCILGLTWQFMRKLKCLISPQSREIVNYVSRSDWINSLKISTAAFFWDKKRKRFLCK